MNIQYFQDGTYSTSQRSQSREAGEPVLFCIRCPGCGVKLKVRERMLSRKGKCPRCGQRLLVRPQHYVVSAVVQADGGCRLEAAPPNH